jgi:hypothetical protein
MGTSIRSAGLLLPALLLLPLSAVAGEAETGAPPEKRAVTGEVLYDGVIDEGEYAFRASFAGGAFVLHWRVEGEEVAFGVSADTAGWVSVGFEPARLMRDADMIVGWIGEGGEAVVEDQFSTGDFGPHVKDESLGGREDLLAFGGARRGGRTVVEFRRKLDTGDERDKPLPLDRAVAILWAVGTSDDPASKHARRGGGTLSLSGGEVEERSAGALPVWPVHAVLMDLGFLFLFAGMVTARRRAKDRFWLPRHQILGITGALVLLTSLGTAITMVSFSGGGHLRVPHAFVGGGAMILVFILPFLGFAIFRSPSHRPLLRALHVWIGRFTLLALLAGSLTGLFAAGIL